MKIYCMSDIHACLESFEAALENVICHLDNDNTMLLLLGDYVHGGDSGRGVLDKIMHLQEQYGNDKVMALMGNHEDMVISGESTIDSMYGGMQWYDNENADDLYISWLSSLPRYYTKAILYLCMPELMKLLVICGNGRHLMTYTPRNIPLKQAG